MLQEGQGLYEGRAVRKHLDGALQDSDADEKHAEAEDHLTDVLRGRVLHEQGNDAAGKEQERRVARQVEGRDLRRDRGTDVRAHDHADRLGQVHQRRVHEADHHHVRGRRALDQHGHQNTDQDGRDALPGYHFQDDLQFVAGSVFQSCRHDGHAVQEKPDAAEKGQYCLQIHFEPHFQVSVIRK